MKNKFRIIVQYVLVFLVVYGCSDIQLLEGLKSDIYENRQTKLTKNETNKTHYWYKGEKVNLYTQSGKSYLLFSASPGVELSGILKNYNILFEDKFTLSSSIISEYGASFDMENLRWAIVQSIDIKDEENCNVLYEGGYYVNDNGLAFFNSNLAFIKVFVGNEEALQKYADKYGYKILGYNKYMPEWYTIDCSLANGMSSLEVANLLYESGEFASAQPDLMPEKDLFSSGPNDTFFCNQWGLKNTGQHSSVKDVDIRFIPAWDITEGSSNIIVAVIDQGFELTHPDLNVYSVSYDTQSGTSPSIIYGSHGTACAGIVGARSNNNYLIAGVASNCKIMSISHPLTSYPNIAQSLADGFNFAWNNGASVISNSWGGIAQSDILDDAIEASLTYGRNGLGCVVVFSVGNNNDGFILYPANSFADIISVGAMSPAGERKSPTSVDGEYWWGSNYGSGLDIVAPGVKIPTTDRSGPYDYYGDDYFLSFNGTSSACPHVSGVAALILSKYPALSSVDVSEAILTSAQKLSNYSFDITQTYGTWNNEVGYGLLSAKAALLAAAGDVDINLTNQTINGHVSYVGRNVYISGITVESGAKFCCCTSNLCYITSAINIASDGKFIVY